jgi:hypothetical protein
MKSVPYPAATPADGLPIRSTAPLTDAVVIGFDTYQSPPAAKQCSRSPVSACAVMKMIGVLAG